MLDESCTNPSSSSSSASPSRRATTASDFTHSAMVTVSKVTRPVTLHQDIRASDKSSMTDYVALISLKDSESSFVWGDTNKIPLKANSMLIFRGNHTHGIPTIPGDEVRFLGPFGFHEFTEIGYGCQGCEISCNEKVSVFDETTTSVCGYNIEVKCDETWSRGTICFDCSQNGFQFFTRTDFFNEEERMICELDQLLTDTSSYEVACTADNDDQVKIKIKNVNGSSSSSRSKKSKSNKKDNLFEDTC